MLHAAATYAVPVLLAWLLVNTLIVAAYRRELWRLWREPVFRYPLLVIESDDWGAGPLDQAVALNQIAEVLSRHRDSTGRAPVFNLALVLAVPDGPAIEAEDRYRRVALDDPRFAPILQALRDGVASGVFALQLHGLEHFWPPTLMASGDPAVAAWLRQPVPGATEQLPSHLQSRWVDTTILPSRSHALPANDAAVAEEVQTYTHIVGEPPAVVVPPTFVWTHDVERAWAAQGMECVVTPGRRFTCRDAEGRPAGGEGPFVNGDQVDGLIYIVRNDYFEPSRGRDARHALAALDRATSLGRPCLLENHRDNFLQDLRQRHASLTELDVLYREALRRYPSLRFLSTRELVRILREGHPQWLTIDPWRRLPAFWARLAAAGRPWKMLRLTGAAALVSGVLRLLAPPVSAVASDADR